MLVKGQQHVRFITGAEHFARADAHLENRRTAGNRRRNRHESHDFLFAAAGEPRQETADGLNTVLGIARDADDRFGNLWKSLGVPPGDWAAMYASLMKGNSFYYKINTQGETR